VSDDAIAQLLQHASNDIDPVLLVLDEHQSPLQALQAPLHAESRALTNRYDVCTSARRQGWPCSFSDFLISRELLLDCKRALYRVSKEKRVVEHVLQSLWLQLPVGGELHIAGYKNEGIKTFAKRAKAAWDCSEELVRADGQLHLYAFIKQADRAELLQTDDYHALQTIGEWKGTPLLSKPGIFAWDRVDDGTGFLLEYLPQLLAGKSVESLRTLDLGCGYGLLALALVQAGCGEVVATDNNAAALRACEGNMQQALPSQNISVVADDCGGNLRGSFDLILCNPPFHQGFDVEQDLTDRFLEAAFLLLKPGGQALFVVNAFIPLERKATVWFSQVEKVADNGRYKLVVITQ
jgi:16S rRNA (guanine1207-N2)-methyltransferase